MDPHQIRSIGTDPDVFESFYREHIEFVRRFIARRVHDPHTAADLTADVFLAVIDSARSYQPTSDSPLPWLVGIARNIIAGEARRTMRKRRADMHLAALPELDDGSLSNIAERLDAERDARQLYSVLSQLPERDRALLELVALDGLSITEAAQALGIKPGTARMRLHRARTKAQSLWSPTVAAQLQEVLT
jgi:RNA polymerase sigma-70 factor (ECF subfamily)